MRMWRIGGKLISEEKLFTGIEGIMDGDLNITVKQGQPVWPEVTDADAGEDALSPAEVIARQAPDLPLLPTALEGTLCLAPTDRYEGFFVAKIKRLA